MNISLRNETLRRLALLLDRARLSNVTAEQLARTPGLTYMGSRIDLDLWSHLVEIYRLPLDLPSLVIVAGSQTGKSLLQMIRMYARMPRFGPIIQMAAWPTEQLSADFAKVRAPEVFDGFDEQTKMVLEPTVFTASMARFGGNIIYWVGQAIGHQHSTKTESVPAAFLTLDEVRRMSLRETRRLERRVSASSYKVIDVISAASPPGTLLEEYWLESDQHIFYSDCGCKSGVSIAHEWPKSVRMAGRGATRRAEFCCPKCGKGISNPREGRWIPQAKNKLRTGYHLPQTLSPAQSPELLMLDWERCLRSPGEGGGPYFFMTDVLGLIVSDPEKRLLSNETIKRWRSADNPYKWGPPPGDGAPTGTAYRWPIAQGWDVMQDLAYGVTFTLDRERSYPVILWLDVHRGPDAWQFVRKRISQFKPNLVVVDAGPDYNESLRLCREKPGHVWRSLYRGSGRDTVKWGKIDFEKESSSGTDTGLEVTIQRGLAVKNYIMAYSNGGMLWIPRPSEYPGRPGDVNPAEEFIEHLQSVQVVEETNPKTGASRTEMHETATLDPHFIHACLYGLVALERIVKLGSPGGEAKFGDPRSVV